jgi:hypothetical protein
MTRVIEGRASWPSPRAAAARACRTAGSQRVTLSMLDGSERSEPA